MNDRNHDNTNTTENEKYTSSFNDPAFYNFDSFVEPSMLLPEDVNYDFSLIDSIPALPSEIPSASASSTDANSSAGSAKTAAGSLYDKLTSNTSSSGSPLPSSPSLYPYIGGSPYSMGSPSSLMMSTGGGADMGGVSSGYTDPNWMHSNRPRRRRSTYASPSLMPQNLYQNNPYMTAAAAAMGPVSPMGFNAALNMPYGNPMMSSPLYHSHPHYMMAPPMSPMNFTVKLPMAPMAPLTPTNYNSSSNGVKIPLVLPCHLQQQQQQHQNSAAPNISKLQTSITSASSVCSSGVPSRCSSIAPNSSISSRSSQAQQNWFAEMSLTKDRFLKDVEGLELNNVTVVELKQILKKFGLNSTGKKVQLVERIKEISAFLKTEGSRKRAKVEESSTVAPLSSNASEVSAAV